MREQLVLLSAVTGISTTPKEILVEQFHHTVPAHKTVQITGTFVGTVTISASNDGNNWLVLATTTVPGGWASDDPWAYTIASVTAYTSGSITAILNY